MGIGAVLQDLISNRGSNVNEVSTATGVSPSTLYSIIRRDSMSVNILDLYEVAKYLGVSLDYFYFKLQNDNKKNTPLFSSEALRIAHIYDDELNADGQEALSTSAQGIVANPKYKKDSLADELSEEI